RAAEKVRPQECSATKMIKESSLDTYLRRKQEKKTKNLIKEMQKVKPETAEANFQASDSPKVKRNNLNKGEKLEERY
ncbi:MAG: hypothetical protein PHO32_09945, partial [Candidatus Cloacimonetes bacterium]|nr:hypothetical protein [Candidatus Cloacimonadota bacterium]